MKAPRQLRPAPLSSGTPARKPAGTSQLRVDYSTRQGAQREYIDRLQRNASNDGNAVTQHGSIQPQSGYSLVAKSPVQCVNTPRKKRRYTKSNHIIKPRRFRYPPGTHGYKAREQRRLGGTFKTKISGSTHESEHTIGYEPLARTTGTRRGKGARARGLENHAPAYQEIKGFHRGHIGTGTSTTADGSGMNSLEYRNTQRSLVEEGQVGNAVQINQLGYAFLPEFQNPSAPLEQQRSADDSFGTMVENLTDLTYGVDDEDKKVSVSPEERAEMYLSRPTAQSGKFPTRDEENEARTRFGLPLLPTTTPSDDDI